MDAGRDGAEHGTGHQFRYGRRPASLAQPARVNNGSNGHIDGADAADIRAVGWFALSTPTFYNFDSPVMGKDETMDGFAQHTGFAGFCPGCRR